MEKIKIKTAFVWECYCGIENFEHAVDANVTREDLDNAYRQMNGLESWESVPEDFASVNVHFVHAPMEVSCKECGMEFSTFDDLELDEFQADE